MNELDIVLTAGKKHGIDEALSIYTSKIDIKDGIRLKAQFGEKHPALNWIEEKFDITPNDMRQMLREYTKAILVIGKDGKMPLDAFWHAMMDIEETLHLNNFYKSIALVSGPCRGCGSCTVVKGKTCAVPDKRRPTLEGLGVDILSTVRRFKKNVDWTGKGFYSVGIVLLE